MVLARQWCWPAPSALLNVSCVINCLSDNSFSCLSSVRSSLCSQSWCSAMPAQLSACCSGPFLCSELVWGAASSVGPSYPFTSCLSKSKLHFKEVFAGTAKGCAGTYPWCWPRVGQWSHSKFSTCSCHPLCACFDRSIESSVDPHLKLSVFPFRDFSLASINTFFTLNHKSRKMFLSNMLFL